MKSPHPNPRSLITAFAIKGAEGHQSQISLSEDLFQEVILLHHKGVKLSHPLRCPSQV